MTPLRHVGRRKNSFQVIGLDQRGAIVLRQNWSRGQIETRLANMALCLIGMEACVGLSRKPQSPGHDAPDAGEIRASLSKGARTISATGRRSPKWYHARRRNSDGRASKSTRPAPPQL